jgi:hypothetical protein
VSDYLLGFDEETVYLYRSAYPTADEARSEFLRLSVEEFGFDRSEVEDIVGVAVEEPAHVEEDGPCMDGTCDCPDVPLWRFAP